jgi:predicted RecB family nuclease
MKITSNIFAAYLKCPTKCWLLTVGQRSSGNTYAEWVKTQNDFYRATQSERLLAQLPNDEIAFSPSTGNVQAANWRAASSLTVQVPTEYCILESVLHAVERVSSTNEGTPTEFIPILFVLANKLDKYDKLLLGFDAFVLSESLGRETRIGKIIHGADSATLRIRVSTFTGEIRARIAKIAALLSSPTPPEPVLNRHCAECEFRDRCRQKAKETDDLSLLSGMSEKERARHRSKGIFTVTQLSYTFRPRRTSKRAKNPAKPHHFALQALAIRENYIYIHGSPILPDCESKVYLDIEGLPDSDFHYLIGALVVTDERELFYSFWADTISEQGTIFTKFAEVISQLPDYRVFHFGNYDAAAMTRASIGLPKRIQEQFETICEKSVNVLSLVTTSIFRHTRTA